MKQILAMALLLMTPLSTLGQSSTPAASRPCTLTVAQAPAIRGVKLGMTLDEFLSLFPGSNDNAQIKQALSESDGYPRFGQAGFGLSPANYPTRDRFAGIATYIVQSFDRRIVQLGVYYEQFPKGARWTQVDDFISKFAESLHLPGASEWLLEADTNHRGLQCNGFQVWASISRDGSSLTLSQSDWVQAQKNRLAAYEEQKRREFRP